MSLILVATVGGVLLERWIGCSPGDVWGYAGAEPWTRPETVRGPPPPCSTRHCARRRSRASAPHCSAHPSGRLGHRNLLAIARCAVTQLDGPALQSAADRDDRRHP